MGSPNRHPKSWGTLPIEQGGTGVTTLVDLVALVGGGGGGSSDHGALTGLADDDHTQYHNDARGDARYSQLGHTHSIANVTGLQTELDSKLEITDVFSSGSAGVVPASGGGTTNFLRADGSWSAPSGGGGGLSYLQALSVSSWRC